jgi:gliding motility-associated-like protein
MVKRLLLLFFNIALCLPLLHAQQVTFQKVYNAQGTISDFFCYDARQTIDGGYVMAGLATVNTTTRPYIFKTDCQGKFVWGKTFGATSSWNNIYTKVLEQKDGSLILLSNIGTFQAYNILLAKLSAQGNTIWRKVINNNLGDDIGQGLCLTKDGGYLISGATNSYGSETIGGGQTDLYFIKLDSNGNKQWAKSYGKNNGIDEAREVIELKSGGYAFTGTFINQGCFKLIYGTLDSNGSLEILKCFGDTLSRNGGYGLSQDGDGNVILFGTTTMRAPIPNYNDDVDHWLIKLKPNGDTIWTRAFNGTSTDGSDNSLSIEIDKRNNILLGTETMSYPSTGFTPNKQVAHKFDANGNLLQSTRYNSTGSQYTKLHKTSDGGYTLSGFTTNPSNIKFRPNLFKLDSNLSSGCNTTDITSLTDVGFAAYKIIDAVADADSGGTVGNATLENTMTTVDSTWCESFPTPSLILASNSPICLGSPVVLNLASNANQFNITWGDTSASQNTTDTIATYNYYAEGIYTITVVASNGCITASKTLQVQITAAPIFTIVSNNANPISGETVTLSTSPTATNYAWNMGQSTASIGVADSGWYSVNALINGCTVTDSIYISFAPADSTFVFVPNAFSPNGDANNPLFTYHYSPNYQFLEMHIFNRWGNKIFETKNVNTFWDGKYLGTDCAMDSYYYMIIFADKGKRVVIKGDVILIR